MPEKEFNLLEEPWIKVIKPTLEIKEVSLTDAIIYAHEYTQLSGEMPTQDIAILRLLLSVVQTVFYRYNIDGEYDELSKDNDSDCEDVLERWQDYWNLQKFPEQIIKKYLKKVYERFWLFHPNTPFWQVSDLQYGTDYGVECMLGNIKESNNPATKHHFSVIDGDEINKLHNAEIARWLINLNAFAVNIKADKKASGTTLPVGTGRLGQLGIVMVNGKNLFEILMLNLCPLKNGTELWNEPKPIWEQDIRLEQGVKISQPDNLPELYTIQSRRIMLLRDEKRNVTGFRAIGGDFYSVEDDFNEPMTLWCEGKPDKKTGKKIYKPKTHNPNVYAWREFPTLLSNNYEHIPGIIQWMKLLCNEEIIETETLITFRMIGIVYGDGMSYTYGDCINDSVVLSAGLLNDLGKEWISLISDEVDKCQLVVIKAISYFSEDICKLIYGVSEKKVLKRHKEHVKDRLEKQYYFCIDGEFREWLSSIKPPLGNREEKLKEWEKKSYFCARRVIEDYIATLNTNIYVYRDDDKEILTIPKILKTFSMKLKDIYKVTDDVI